MGKIFDKIIFSSLLAIGFYFFYHGTFKSPALCIALALLSCAVCRSLLHKIFDLIRRTHWMQARRFRRQSKGVLMRIATLPKAEADAIAESLIQRAYHADCTACMLQKHPSATISEDILFDLWKSHTGKEKIAVLATCRMSEACRAMAAGLTVPRLILFDGDAVTDLLAEHPDLCPEAAQTPPVRLRLRLYRLRAAIFNRKNAPRCITIALSMMMMHLITRSISYLICSCALMLTAVLSIARRSRPVRRI